MAETSRQKASRPRVSSVASCWFPGSVAADQRPVRWNRAVFARGQILDRDLGSATSEICSLRGRRDGGPQEPPSHPPSRPDYPL